MSGIVYTISIVEKKDHIMFGVAKKRLPVGRRLVEHMRSIAEYFMKQ